MVRVFVACIIVVNAFASVDASAYQSLIPSAQKKKPWLAQRIWKGGMKVARAMAYPFALTGRFVNKHVFSSETCRIARRQIKELEASTFLDPSNGKKSLKRRIVEASKALLEANDSFLPEIDRCARVLEACSITIASFLYSSNRWEIVVPRVLVLLLVGMDEFGTGNLFKRIQDWNNMVLKFGYALFELLHQSRILVRLGTGDYLTIGGQLEILDFFSNKSREGLLTDLFEGLKYFEKGLVSWEKIRAGVAQAALKDRSIFQTGLQRFTKGFFKKYFLSFPPGYVLAAICGATGSRMNRHKFESTLGAPLSTDDEVVKAITPLISRFSEFAPIRNEKTDGHKNHPDLLRGLLAADFFMINNPLSFGLQERAASLPGRLFVRWMCNPNPSSGSNDFELASKAADAAARLADAGDPEWVASFVGAGAEGVLLESERAVFSLLGDYGDEELERTKTEWFDHVKRVRARLGVTAGLMILGKITVSVILYYTGIPIGQIVPGFLSPFMTPMIQPHPWP